MPHGATLTIRSSGITISQPDGYAGETETDKKTKKKRVEIFVSLMRENCEAYKTIEGKQLV